jgi:CRP/FNR family cyclic AMP-dependent transcriptional regulator
LSIIDLLSGNSRLVKIAAGDLIFAQGDRGEVMYVVAEGQAQILIDGKAVETVAAGGIVGEMALIDSGARSASAIAKTECLLVPLDERGFRELVSRQPEFALLVMSILVQRLRRMDAEH